MRTQSKEWAESKLPNEDGQEIGAGCPASDLFAPWWAVNVPESESDYTCTRCGHFVHLEHGSEWLGPDDNYHWNLCNSCAQELVLEMWQRLQSIANIVTTEHETKDAFIGRVRSVLWANDERSNRGSADE